MNAIRTGYEKYNQDGNIDVDSSIAYMVQKLEERNPGKYTSFLSSLNKIKILLTLLRVKQGVSRAQIVCLVYYALRDIDDGADGHSPHILPAEERNAFVQEKKKTVLGLTELHKEDLFDMLVEKIFAKSSYINEMKQVVKWMIELMDSMAFDAKRIAVWSESKTLEKKTREEINKNYYQCDVTGTIFPLSALFGLDPTIATQILEPLGKACRIAYTLMDLLEDPKEGLLNIPLEDLEVFGISDDDIEQLVLANSLYDLPESIKRRCVCMISEMDFEVMTYERRIAQHQIPLTYSRNPFLKYIYNLVLRKLVLPVGYMWDIKEVRKRYSGLITNFHISHSC